MAHEADGPDNRGRPAAGTAHQTRNSARKDAGNGEGGASVTKGKASTARPKADRGSDDASRQNRSAQSGTDGGSNQQSGRKRRRWRSRRKKGNGPQSAGAQQSQLPENATLDAQLGEATLPASLSAISSPQAASLPHKEKPTVDRRGSGRSRKPSVSNQNEPSAQKSRADGSPSKAEDRKYDERKSRARGRQTGSRYDRSSGGAERGGAQERSPQTRGQRGRDEARQAEQSNIRAQSGRDHPPRSARPSRHPVRAEGRASYAALDLGTNNCRLLVAEPHGQSFRVVDAFSRIVRLGEGLSQTGRLSDDAQERAIAALKVCQSKLAYRKVKRFRLIATEACRRAANGGTFLHKVYKETGLKLEIVNRETEARLAVAGCASLVHPEAEGVVLFDIGGGSSEVVWLDLDPMGDDGLPLPGEKRNRQTRRAMRHLSERIRCWTSLQVGVVTLSEKHGGTIVGREQFEAMVAEVRDMLHEFEEREALAKAIESKHIHMLGTSGTVTTLAGVHLGLERYDRRQVDGTWLSDHELRSMINRILEMNFEERIKNPCIGQDRADLVLAGCAILEAFHREWPVSRLRVADRGLREGILTEMMIDDGVWNPQLAKKKQGKSRRPRRRGGRGHRGQGATQPSQDEKS